MDQDHIPKLRKHPGLIIWNERRPAELRFLPESLDEEIQKVFELSKDIQESYRAPGARGRPLVYYSGTKTEFVYVFIHGPFMNHNQFRYLAEASFSEGINSISTILPGHEIGEVGALGLYNETDWIEHA
ncbi:MAG: hypothetical protein NDJ89_10905 [Oligoflexia bacterium]|nr:hypothetical protein [Oligoflexia bacterium]